MLKEKDLVFYREWLPLKKRRVSHYGYACGQRTIQRKSL